MFIGQFVPYIFVAIVLYTIIGFAVDIRNFDRTEGGYEPPYEGWTGEPVDWSAMESTSEGFHKRGWVADTYVDCRTGMIRFKFFRLISINFRPFSDRALKVHKPREACQENGFEPEF